MMPEQQLCGPCLSHEAVTQAIEAGKESDRKAEGYFAKLFEQQAAMDKKLSVLMDQFEGMKRVHIRMDAIEEAHRNLDRKVDVRMAFLGGGLAVAGCIWAVGKAFFPLIARLIT